jgi:hypothetical protein
MNGVITVRDCSVTLRASRRGRRSGRVLASLVADRAELRLRQRLYGQQRTAAGTGERVSIGTSHGAVGNRAVGARLVDSRAVDAKTVEVSTALIRRTSAQPSRRAVLHVQAPGDPAVPDDLASWFTERAFHFYAASLHLPPSARLSTRAAGRAWQPAFADLDAACTRLRRADGMATVIVTAQGRAAVAAALWSDSRGASHVVPPSRSKGTAGMTGDTGCPSRADALILAAPAWPAPAWPARSLHLNIACPVLVVADSGVQPARSRAWPRWPRRTVAPALPLGSHVTWLALAEAGADRRLFLDELGRWLGAYMYGSLPDQLL